MSPRGCNWEDSGLLNIVHVQEYSKIMSWNGESAPEQFYLSDQYRKMINKEISQINTVQFMKTGSRIIYFKQILLVDYISLYFQQCPQEIRPLGSKQFLQQQKDVHVLQSEWTETRTGQLHLTCPWYSLKPPKG